MKPVNYTSAEKMLLFIPDISGFTKFVHETDISYSQHIIKELLETLIDANDIGLEISEIEGDAILFYRKGKKPTTREILLQAKKMHTKFHNCLKKYGASNINTNDLKLKFIIHYGDISINKVKNRFKLFGKDLIVAHRLMKNDISIKEYVLMTNQLINTCSSWTEIAQIGWETSCTGEKNYDFGNVKYCYLSLANLNAHISETRTESYIYYPNIDTLLILNYTTKASTVVLLDMFNNAVFRQLYNNLSQSVNLYSQDVSKMWQKFYLSIFVKPVNQAVI